ncbi:hypothetical protein M436DRAFT_66176 [Aureobasidium namibiae CBS 147.97]|uniref:Uncharacterized protein n=1 Tax=Aureobasidium namibiae CBS 147.97 TaxID=1043004 RepID=A0A074X815_9PEZI
MPPTKSQKAAKVADTGDDNQGFVRKQRQMHKAARRSDARRKIEKNRESRHKELQARIKVLKRVAPVQQSGTRGDTDAPSSDQTAFDTLRSLLARKTAIEQRIAQTIDGLEKAMGTTFREFQVVLASRSQLLSSANAPADASAASTALIPKS